MSLITQCPACATLFKVVPDQLRVSDGWVRCGHCDEVFDANLHMQPHVQIVNATPQRVEAPNVEPPRSHDALPATVVESGESGALTEQDSPDSLPPDADALTVPMQRENVGPDEDEGAGEEDKSITSVEPTLSFMQPSSARFASDRPLVRAAMIAVCSLLMALLGAQVVVHERNRIAATHPGTQPALVEICLLLNCEIAPWRHIDSVVIDSSSFVKLQANVYRLNFTLKNTSSIAVATPALELSLTNLHDQATIRRVIQTSEFGLPQAQAQLAPNGELHASVPLKVLTQTDAEHISGYRLLAFYP